MHTSDNNKKTPWRPPPSNKWLCLVVTMQLGDPEFLEVFLFLQPPVSCKLLSKLTFWLSIKCWITARNTSFILQVCLEKVSSWGGQGVRERMGLSQVPSEDWCTVTALADHHDPLWWSQLCTYLGNHGLHNNATAFAQSPFSSHSDSWC